MSLLNRYIKHHLFIIFTIIFLLKLYFARVLLFDSFNIFQTFYVEIGYFLVIFALFELFNSQKVKFILYLILDLFLSVLLIAVLLYKSYYGNMVNVYALSLLNQVGTVQDSLLSLFNPIYCLLLIDFVILVILAIVKRNVFFQSNGGKNYKFISGVVVIGLIAISVNVLSNKNGEIADTVVAAQKQGIFTSQMLTVASINMDQNTIAEDALVSIPEKILELKELTIIPEEERKFSGIAEGKNVIAIQVEALQNFTIGLEVDGKEVTPYLNELIKDSIYFPNVYQQIGPGNTSDAELFLTPLFTRMPGKLLQKYYQTVLFQAFQNY
ncbi:MAG TPA: hypothetical protein VNR38_20865 [Ureibacillus sp.]|nr:hypothetical protein [Ureibacillus sp.]